MLSCPFHQLSCWLQERQEWERRDGVGLGRGKTGLGGVLKGQNRVGIGKDGSRTKAGMGMC